MSTHLLPVGTKNNVPVKYKPINMTGTVTSTFACEHNRNIYLAAIINGTYIRLQKLNLLTNTLTNIGDVQLSSMVTNLGDMIVTDEHIYFTSASASTYIYQVQISNLTVTRYTLTKKYSSFGRMTMLFDKKTIAILKTDGFIFFDTTTYISTVKTGLSTLNRIDIAASKSLLISIPNTTCNYAHIYDVTTSTFETLTLPTTQEARVCYDNGYFYIVEKNYLTIYDTSTKTIKTSVVVPWTSPKTVACSNGIVFVTNSSSNVLWIYDTNHSIYKTIILPWTIPNHTSSNITLHCSFKGYMFLPYLTLCIIDYSNNAKYNLGGVFDQYVFITDEANKNTYQYDNRFVTFKDTYVEIHDGEIVKPITTVDETNHIRKASISKKEYKKLKSLSFMTT